MTTFPLLAMGPPLNKLLSYLEFFPGFLLEKNYTKTREKIVDAFAKWCLAPNTASPE
jgi:hypothetical protein